MPTSFVISLFQAEIDILNKEVEGLQRELGNTLESLDGTKKRARETRESVSSLKHELRNASTKVKELTAEAEARDKLIETFTKILLQKIGADDEENGGLDESTVGTERMDLNSLEKSLKLSLAQDV